jgi:hypothetical protein
MLAAQIGDGNPSLMLFQNANDLVFVNLLRFISGPFSWARAYLKLD